MKEVLCCYVVRGGIIGDKKYREVIFFPVIQGET